MKKIHILLIKSFLKPFAATFFIVMFVLLMLFLFKYIDDLIGKGFEFTVILELLWYVSATNVAMALPLAILLSSIMTFGNLGEQYELVAIKSAGISLQRAMAPLFVFVAILSISALSFSNYILPIANLRMGSLLYDVKNKKASFLVEEGIFNTSIPGYAIRVDKKHKDEKTLSGVTIYTHSPNGNTSIVLAKGGEMYKTPDNLFLVLKLREGVRYEESTGDKGYNPRQRLTRTFFKTTEQHFDLSSFAFKREDQSLFKKHYMMLNIQELSHDVDSLAHGLDSTRNTYFFYVKNSYRYFQPSEIQWANVSKKSPPEKLNEKDILQNIPQEIRLEVLNNASNQINNIKSSIESNRNSLNGLNKQVKDYTVELYRKFTLPVSCLVLFLIGAPMGAIIRKGGLGLPLVVCILFFLAFHIVSTITEKMTKEGDLNPIIGMWTSIVIFGLVGIFLSYKATTDSALFDAERYKLFFKKLFDRKLKQA